jgi:hypothetical protein
LIPLWTSFDSGSFMVFEVVFGLFQQLAKACRSFFRLPRLASRAEIWYLAVANTRTSILRHIKTLAVALAAGVLAATASAQTPPSPTEFSFAMGQIVGSNLACGGTKDELTPVAEKAFAKLKIDVSEGNENYKKFVEGIADGVKTVKGGAAKCDDVKAGLAQFKEKLGS